MGVDLSEYKNMKSGFLFASTAAADFDHIAAHVNSLGTSWKAKVPKFESLESVRQLLGTDVAENRQLVGSLPESEVSNADVPDDFDVRTNWPACASVTGDIRD